MAHHLEKASIIKKAKMQLTKVCHSKLLCLKAFLQSILIIFSANAPAKARDDLLIFLCWFQKWVTLSDDLICSTQETRSLFWLNLGTVKCKALKTFRTLDPLGEGGAAPLRPCWTKH